MWGYVKGYAAIVFPSLLSHSLTYERLSSIKNAEVALFSLAAAGEIDLSQFPLSAHADDFPRHRLLPSAAEHQHAVDDARRVAFPVVVIAAATLLARLRRDLARLATLSLACHAASPARSRFRPSPPLHVILPSTNDDANMLLADRYRMPTHAGSEGSSRNTF